MEHRKRSKSKLSAGTDEGRHRLSDSYSDKVGITAPPPDSKTDVIHNVKKSYELPATTSGPKHQPKSKHQSNHQQTFPTEEQKAAGINTLYSNGAPLGISQPMLQAATLFAGSSGCAVPRAYNNPCQPISGPNTMVGGLVGLNNNNCGQFGPNMLGPMGVCGPQIMPMGAMNLGQLGIDTMSGPVNYSQGPQASLNMTQGTMSMSAPGPQASANMAPSIGFNDLSSMQQNGTLESEAMLRCLTGLLKSLLPQPKSQVTCTKEIYVGIPCNANRKCINKFLSHARNIGPNQLCCRPAAPPPPCCDPCNSNPRPICCDPCKSPPPRPICCDLCKPPPPPRPTCCDPCKPPPRPTCCDPCKPPPRPTCCDPCKPPPPRPACCDPCKPPPPPCDLCKPCGCGKCQPCCAAPIPPCCCACRPPRRAVVKKKCKLMSSKSMSKESDRLSNSSAPRSSCGSTRGKLHETIDGGNNAQTQDVSVEVEGFSVPKRNVVTGMLSNENSTSQHSRGPSAYSPNRTPPRSPGTPGSLTSDLREFMADFDNNPTRASAGSPKVPSVQPQSHPFSLAQASRMAGNGGGRANNETFYNSNNNGNEKSDNGRQSGKYWSIG